MSELRELEQTVKVNGTIYETAPDSKMMQTNNKGCDICHNVQIAVDDKNHMVVAVDVTSEPVDKEQLHNMTLQAKEELGVETIAVIADKGYYSARQFAKCKEDNIVPIVAKADRSFMAATKGYEKSQFKYDEIRMDIFVHKAICSGHISTERNTHRKRTSNGIKTLKRAQLPGKGSMQ